MNITKCWIIKSAWNETMCVWCHAKKSKHTHTQLYALYQELNESVYSIISNRVFLLSFLFIHKPIFKKLKLLLLRLIGLNILNCCTREQLFSTWVVFPCKKIKRDIWCGTNEMMALCRLIINDGSRCVINDYLRRFNMVTNPLEISLICKRNHLKTKNKTNIALSTAKSKSEGV